MSTPPRLEPAPLRLALAPPRALWNLFLAAVVLRLLLLGYWSLWLDEGATWAAATAPTWKDTVFAESNHPPLWWIVTRAWTSLFGTSEAALRAPAAILDLVAVGLAWLLGLRVLVPELAPRRGGFSRADDGGEGRRIAVWFAGFVAVAAYFLEYAQEARMYPALLVVSLGLSLLYLRWLDRNDRLSLVLYALVGTLGLYTHYFAVWPLVAHAAHAIWLARQTRKRADAVDARPFLAAVAAAGLLFVPWFVYCATHYAGLAKLVMNPVAVLLHAVWRMGAGPALVVQDGLRVQEGAAAVLAEEWPVILVTAVLWFVPLALGFFALRKRPGLRSFALANLFVPVGILLAVYAWFPLIQERYLVFLSPWVFLLVVLGASSAKGILRPVLLGGLVLVIGAGTALYTAASGVLVPDGRTRQLDDRPVPERFVLDPESPLVRLGHGHAYAREPWRDVYDFVQRFAQPGDVVALHPGYVHTVWDYYASRGAEIEGNALLDTVRLPRLEESPEEIARRFGERLGKARRVFLVLSRHETEDRDHYYPLLRDLLVRLWGVPHRFTVLPPIEFQASWGIRVAVFTRS